MAISSWKTANTIIDRKLPKYDEVQKKFSLKECTSGTGI